VLLFWFVHSSQPLLMKPNKFGRFVNAKTLSLSFEGFVAGTGIEPVFAP
jgi:hypothetical protein